MYIYIYIYVYLLAAALIHSRFRSHFCSSPSVSQAPRVCVLDLMAPGWSTEVEPGKHTDQGKFKKLAARVEATLTKQCLNPESKQINPCLILVSPLNRLGAPPNVKHIHFTILQGFKLKGYDRTRPAIGICVMYTTEAGKRKLLEHNLRFSKHCKLLPPVVGGSGEMYGSLACSHLNISFRLIKHNSFSPIGDLSSLIEGEDCQSLKEAALNGHKWWILPEDVDPSEQAEISLWRNQDQNENQATHEIEILQTLMNITEDMSKTTSKVTLSDLIAKAERKNPAKLSDASMSTLAKLYTQFLSASQQHLCTELVDYHSETVNPKELVISIAFLKTLTDEEVLKDLHCFRHYCIQAQYTNEKVRQQASGPALAAFIEPSTLLQLCKKTEELKAVEEKLREVREKYLPILEEGLDARQARLELSVYCDLIIRCLLSKPWPLDLDLKLTLPLGRFSQEKMLQLGNFWAKLVDKKHPDLNFGENSGLGVTDEEEDEDLKQHVDLENIRALKRKSSDPVPDLARKFARGDKVTVIRKMTWSIPQKKNADFRKDLPEGLEGQVEGFADAENRQVLLQVSLKLPDGKVEVVRAVYPRNLMLSSDYKLKEAGKVTEPVQEDSSGSSKDPPGTPQGTKRAAPPAWALMGWDPESVQLEPQWSKLLSDAGKTNRLFWLKSNIGKCLESLHYAVPQYTEKDLVVLHRKNEKGAWKTELWTKRDFNPSEILFAPLSSQLKETHLMALASVQVDIPKYGSGAHPEGGNLSLDGRGSTVLAAPGRVDSQEHQGNLFWLVQRTSDKVKVNMTLESVTMQQQVTLNFPVLKKKKHVVEWDPADLPSVPVLLNRKAIKAHTLLAVYLEDKK